MKLPKITCLTIKTSITYSKQAKVDSEAVTRRCPVKKMFLKFSQNSQENTCARDNVGGL